MIISIYKTVLNIYRCQNPLLVTTRKHNNSEKHNGMILQLSKITKALKNNTMIIRCYYTWSLKQQNYKDNKIVYITYKICLISSQNLIPFFGLINKIFIIIRSSSTKWRTFNGPPARMSTNSR